MAKRLLIRSPNWIGDHVMALELYRAVRSVHADARITLLCVPQVAGLALGDLWDEQIVLDPAERSFPRGVKQAARRLAPLGFDLAYCLPASFSASYLLYAAGIRERIGFSGDWNRWLLTRAVPWPGRKAGRHKSDLFLDLLGSQAPVTSDPRAPSPPTREKLGVIAPGASLPLREWPYYSELLDRFLNRFPEWRFVVVGGPGEAKWKALVARKASPRLEDAIGKTTLDELIALCRRAGLVVANDSGVAHLSARLAEAPTLVLFGPGDPAYVKPRGSRVAVARAEGVKCSPCEKPYCAAPFGYQRCLRDLSVETVLREAESLVSL